MITVKKGKRENSITIDYNLKIQLTTCKPRNLYPFSRFSPRLSLALYISSFAFPTLSTSSVNVYTYPRRESPPFPRSLSCRFRVASHRKLSRSLAQQNVKKIACIGAGYVGGPSESTVSIVPLCVPLCLDTGLNFEDLRAKFGGKKNVRHSDS